MHALRAERLQARLLHGKHGAHPVEGFVSQIVLCRAHEIHEKRHERWMQHSEAVAQRVLRVGNLVAIVVIVLNVREKRVAVRIYWRRSKKLKKQ